MLCCTCSACCAVHVVHHTRCTVLVCRSTVHESQACMPLSRALDSHTGLLVTTESVRATVLVSCDLQVHSVRRSTVQKQGKCSFQCMDSATKTFCGSKQAFFMICGSRIWPTGFEDFLHALHKKFGRAMTAHSRPVRWDIVSSGGFLKSPVAS